MLSALLTAGQATRLASMDTVPDETTLLARLHPLMEKYGVRISPSEFYQAVNLHFHAAESRVYDNVHREMWQVLPRQFALLTDDCLPAQMTGLRVLDIGSGTGLSAELFLQTALGSRTTELHLLDTSVEMLRVAMQRGKRWSVPLETHCCSISELPLAEQFDVILSCSVLHHIADLKTFLRKISLHQRAGGLFLHLQDQNADFADDPQYLSRLREYREAHARSERPLIGELTPARIYRRIKWALGKRYDYIAKTNRSLLRAGIIQTKMKAIDLWSVTDIRVSPTVNGISLCGLRSLLPEYDLISRRSYSFFGEGGENLPPKFREAENTLIGQKAPNGHLVTGAWKKRC